MTSIDKSTLWANRKCLLICSAVAMASMQYGIDTAAVGGLQAMPGFLMVFGYEDPTSPLGYGIDSTVQQLMTSLMNLGACISSIAAGIFGAYFGRRPALWLACLLCSGSVALQIGSSSPAGLYVGRLFLGFSNGFFVVFSTVYCSEAAPAHLREIMVGLFSFYVNLGSIIGSVVDNYTKHHLSKLSYRIPLACMFIVPCLLTISLLFVPESPRWLLHHDQTDAARKSLETLRSDHGEQLELEWAEMLRGVAEEQRIAKSTQLMDMFKGHDRRRTLLCYATIASQSASGSWFFIGYQTYFLSLAGITKAFEYTIMITCIGFIACGIASSVSPNSKATGNVLVAFTALFMFCYNAGVGVATSPLATEMVSSRLRASTVGSANALGYFLAWLGPQYSYIWAASNFICLIWFYFFIPETKARSLEELDEIFEEGISARKFKQYQCRIVEDAKHDVFGEKVEAVK
ncbi:hypothetical protein SNOG_04466 [Parastagonospora nodorum SN15]|uniref:Major facilitator superfamily (MFS) profile domain-containing protein n=1 Tax=Phaeosphaeria nodorum (strain SN15 / ATCC MYA-4574 / FGSC 10173) TaxID=321614 RepID=Q0UUU8_PHANO|nr:hypothetical protein SNOG_04466 [Parastagonospora nodorum SN15]EAT88226.1 hypothetical protein SNOG_04466 [Parastagonospora nodorum SN15]